MLLFMMLYWNIIVLKMSLFTLLIYIYYAVNTVDTIADVDASGLPFENGSVSQFHIIMWSSSWSFYAVVDVDYTVASVVSDITCVVDFVAVVIADAAEIHMLEVMLMLLVFMLLQHYFHNISATTC